MTKIDKYVNILWISDIHWITDYYDNYELHKNQLEQFLKSFKSICMDKLESGKKIDYIIITGDLAQNGDSNEYEQLFTKVINPLSELNGATVIPVPGNHDLDRIEIKENQKFIDEFIGKVKKDDEIIPGTKKKRHFREVFFLNHRKEFLAMFKAYSLFCKDILKPMRETIIYNETYKEHALFGYVIDKQSKIIFIILNSSWYSFGEVFLEHFIKPNQAFEVAEIEDIRKKISLINNEYGKQILGLDLIGEISEILEILQNYPEFVVINLMHHPINWLIKNDQIPHEDYNLTKIMDHVDLLLTGHEHVLLRQPIKFINNKKILHLEAGAFMNPPKTGTPFKANDNWFSILEINTTKRTVVQTRVTFDANVNKWNETPSLIHNLNKKHQLIFSEKRRIELVKKIQSSQEVFMMTYFVQKKLSKKDNYYLDEKKDIYFFQGGNEITITTKEFLEIIENQHRVVEKICFVFVDLFHIFANQYSEPNNNRLVTLNKIKQDYDMKFDAFRYNLFAKFSDNQAIKYSNLMLISKIVPFWDIEHFNFVSV